MGSMVGLSVPDWLAHGGMNWLELVLATPVVLWADYHPYFVRAMQDARHWTANMFTLIGLGTGAAWGFSVAATVDTELFPAGFRGEHGVCKSGSKRDSPAEEPPFDPDLQGI